MRGVHKNIIIIEDQSETYRRPIGDRHAPWEANMPGLQRQIIV